MPGAGQSQRENPAPHADGARPAWRSTVCVAVFLIVAAAGLAGDLVSKHVVFDRLLNRREVARRMSELQARTAQSITTAQALAYANRVGLTSRKLAGGVRLTLSTNPGVVFGGKLPPWLVLVATAAAIGLVGYFFATAPAGGKAMHVGLALILAGALGNLYDRLFSVVRVPGLAGAEPIRREVRDFIDCSALSYPWVFNVADAWLVIGVALLVLRWAFVEARQRRARGHDAG